MKRSRSIQLALMGAVPLLFTACDDATQAQVAENSTATCADADADSAACEQRRRAYERDTPRWQSRDECESSTGEECRQYVATGGNHWFVPAVTGYMLGRYLGHHRYDDFRSYGGFGGSPLYRNRADRSSWSGPPGGSAGPSTEETLSRGGYGSRSAARASWGG